MKTFFKLLLTVLLLSGAAYGAGWKLGWWGQPERTDFLTEKARVGTIRKTVNATGEISAAQLVSVGAQVSGQIQKLHVVLGQQVKKGDPVAEIDSTTQENDIKINGAKLKTYEAQLASRKVDLKVAQTQYDREKRLFDRNATSSESMENAENALAAAKASLEETASLIEQTRISLSTAEVNLGYTRINSPLDGTVVSIPVEEGQTVNANQTTPTIVWIADLARMEIKMQISEGDVTKVKPGMTVISSILSEPDRRFRGKLETIDPGLTTLTNGSYTGATDSASAVYYYGKFIVANTDGPLRIGMTTQNVIVVDEARDVLIVPTIAITRERNKDGDRSYVRVLQADRTPLAKEIQVGLSDNLHTEVRSGLADGEEVVTASMTAAEIDSSVANRRRGPGGPRF